jgi:hypothetical protein
MKRVAQLEQAGKRLLIRGEYTKPKRVTRGRQRPSLPQLRKLFEELAERIGVSTAEITQVRPGNRTDLSGEADELKQARWYIAKELRASHDPPPTFDRIGAVMGGITGGRVHQIINEFEEVKEEDDGK